MPEIVALTVSYRYTDYLVHCLPNLQHVSKWFIVTDPSDQATIDLVASHDKIELLFHDLSTVFNKSGALRLAQVEAHARYPDAWMLVVDSDIVLPDDFGKVIEDRLSDKEAMYGVARDIYRTAEQFLDDSGSGSGVQKEMCAFFGFFQLYFDKSKLYAHFSPDASKCDLVFRTLFPKRVALPMTVKHLGPCRVNWSGRKSGAFVSK